MNISNEEVCCASFERLHSLGSGECTYRCIPCKLLGKEKYIIPNKSGFTNLINHLKRKFNNTNNYHLLYFVGHGDAVCVHQSITKGHSIEKMVGKTIQDVHDWIDLIVSELLPFSFCKKENVRKYVRMGSICTVTLKKYMLTLRDKVTEIIRSELPSLFSLVVDGWENPNHQHVVAVYATYGIYKDGVFLIKRPLLSISTLNKPTSENAQSHAEYITYVLAEFGKTCENVISITADNCNLNPATCNLLKVKMIGCKSHLLNLFIKDYCKEHEIVLTKVHNLMVTCRKRRHLTVLEQVTSLKPKIRNATRWSSTFKMLDR